MLDSTACIDFLKGRENIKKKLDEMNSLLCISTITLYEVSIGLERTKRLKSEERFNELFAQWLQFLTSLQIFTLDVKAAEHSAKINDELEVNGKKIDDNDILIMGIMKANDVDEIITRNPDHFNRVTDITAIPY
jgi:predicted nucleic acid-binding protein